VHKSGLAPCIAVVVVVVVVIVVVVVYPSYPPRRTALGLLLLTLLLNIAQLLHFCFGLKSDMQRTLFRVPITWPHTCTLSFLFSLSFRCVSVSAGAGGRWVRQQELARNRHSVACHSRDLWACRHRRYTCYSRYIYTHAHPYTLQIEDSCHSEDNPIFTPWGIYTRGSLSEVKPSEDRDKMSSVVW